MKQIRVCGPLVVLFILLSVGEAAAQYVFPTPTPTPSPSPKPTPTVAPQPAPPPCPTVTVQARTRRRIRDGDPVGFTVNIAGGDPKVVAMIIWSTPGGSIISGQGTRRIEVDTTGAGSTPDREVRGEVWVGGYAPQCLLQASSTVRVIPPAKKLGEFGPIDDEKLKKNLEAIANYVSQTPDSLYVIVYGGRNSERGFAYEWLRRIREALVATGLSPRRVITINGGLREEPIFDFWIVPRGADPPRPTPSIRTGQPSPAPTRDF